VGASEANAEERWLIHGVSGAAMDKHLTQSVLADRWGLSPRTLERWRWTGEGPPFLKVGRRVCYRIGDIEAFEAQRVQTATADSLAVIPSGGRSS
jgi:hypothetical protein